jgi:hypothetical protein
MKTLSFAFFVFFSLLLLSELKSEVSFYPSWGYPGQIIKVVGTDPGLRTINFDGRPISYASASGIYFQIPRETTEGNHSVELSYGSSPVRINLPVRLLPLRSIWPAPRIEDVAINTLTPEIKLSVSAANASPDTRVRVLIADDSRVQVLCESCRTGFFSAISSDFFNRAGYDPSAYGYPVFHYISLLVTIPSSFGAPVTAAMGRTLRVEMISP